MEPLNSDAIAGLLSEGVKPVFLLGAGASVRSGVPLASELVEPMAKFAYCKANGRAVGDPTLMRSDWFRWLESKAWFRTDVARGDLYPAAVEDLLQPKVARREFFQGILRNALDPSQGYGHLVGLMAKRALSHVLTTNFDRLLARSIESTRAPGYCEEIKTASDLTMFDTASVVPQIVYLHGSVDHYSDKNLIAETQRLDEELVELLLPLLRDRPLVVIGYRGAEPSVMRHLLIEQAGSCKGFRRGIYWCYRKGADPIAESALLGELKSVIGSNLLSVEIDGFDELMAILDRKVMGSPATAQSVGRSRAQATSLPFDMQPADCTLSSLNDALIREKLVAYSKAMHEAPPALESNERLLLAMCAHHLAVDLAGQTRPTRGAQLLFSRTVDSQVAHASIEVSVSGPKDWVASVLDTTSDSVQEKEYIEFSGSLWEQLDQAMSLLSRVNRSFRMKGAVSHTAYPYPPLALKELATNLIAHRSYTAQATAKVIVTPEEIRFQNPGGLVESVQRDLEDASLQEVIGVGSRRPTGYRNPVVADFFYSAGAMDKAGSGLLDVLKEAANNLNQVAFGPSDDNANFVASIRCRPEALQVNAETRTARSTTGELRYSANLLRITQWPAEIWRLGTLEESKKINKMEQFGPDPFGCARGWIWTFASRASANARGLYSVALEDESTSVPTETLLGDRDAHSVVPQLLNQSLALHLQKLGLLARFEAGRIRAYYPAVDGQPKEISYKSTFKQARRTVAKPIISRSTGQVVYWEHKAVYLRFEQFGSQWALSLLPGYVFTLDGETRPLASERIGPLSTRRASRDCGIL